METHIYYTGVRPEVIEYLKSEELAILLSKLQLDVKVISERTSLITATKAFKDVNMQLFAISSEIQQRFIEIDKKEWLSNECTYIINDIEDAKQAVEDVYKISKINKQKPEEIVIEEPEMVEEEVLLPEQQEEVDIFGDIVATAEVKDKQEPSGVRQTEAFKEEDNNFISPNKLRHQEVKEDRVRMFIYEDTGAYGIEEMIDISEFENTKKKIDQQLIDLNEQVVDLENKLEEYEVKYMGYISPEENQALLDKIAELEIEKDKAIASLEDLNKVNHKQLKEELEFYKTQYESMKKEISDIQKTYTEIKIDRDNKLLEIEKLEEELKETTFKIEKLKEISEVTEVKHNTKENLVIENLKLAKEIKTAKTDKMKIEKENSILLMQLENMRLKMQSTTGNVPNISGVFENIEIVFSLSYLGNRLFYKNILTSQPYIIDKEWVIDLGSNSEIKQAVELQAVKSPYKWLIDNKTIEESVSIKKENTGGFLLNKENQKIITTFAHIQPRFLYTNQVNWQQKLEDLNSRGRSLLYIGCLNNNDCYNLIKLLQLKQVKVKMTCILSNTKDSFMLDKMSLDGLSIKGVSFIGDRNFKYSSFPIASFYEEN